MVGIDVYCCSDCSVVYEIQNLLQGGLELYRNFLMYGILDFEYVSYVKKYLFFVFFGGLEVVIFQNGWIFV